jgi:aminopeptidase N
LSQRSAEGADDYVPGHGDLHFDVLSYALTLRYGVEDNRLSGRAILRCRVARYTDRLVLDLHRLSVSKVTVEGARPAKYAHRGGRLEIRLQRPASVGAELTVTVVYSGRPAPVGGPLGDAGWEELADGVIVASQPHGAPSWFPCNDRPSDKASYVVELTAPTAYHVLCNGVLVEQRRGASATTWRYEQSEPMATYLATVQIGRYTVRRLADEPVPVEIAFPDAIRDRSDGPFARQGEMMSAFVRMFGDYPFAAPYQAVVTEDDLEIPLEAQGLSIFGANFLEDDWSTERLVAHELSHQWFGNSLTIRGWRDIWMHEGFACYSEWLWSEESGHGSADGHAREHWKRLDDLPQDLLLGDPGPDDMFDDRVYKRGALLLHALRLTMGDDTFFGFLRTWVADHRHGSVGRDELTELVVEVGGGECADLLVAWLDELSLPELPPA